MKVIKAQSLAPDAPVNTYFVPTIREAMAHSNKTWGSEYDRVERKEVSGGSAMLWPGAATNVRPPDAFPEARKYEEVE